MAGSSEQQEAVGENTSTVDSQNVTKPAPTSPARSDKSSDSEGRPVREKLKETRIDALATSDSAPTADQQMEDIPNGSTNTEQSASGSDSDRGRLRKKRSREDFEDEKDGDDHPEKKHEKERHHVRKRSRDVKDIESGAPLMPSATSVATIEENDADEQMTTPSKDTAKTTAAATNTGTDTSPKNKRTHDQVEEGTTPVDQTTKDALTNSKPASKAEDERDSKRPRDQDEAQPATATQAAPKVCLCRVRSFYVLF